MPQTIREGSRGELVQKWQRIVGAKPDGAFGPKTKAATVVWQAGRGLTADGIVGPLTWGAALAGDTEPPEALPPLVRGLDLSVFQGDVPDSTWSVLAKAGVKFSIMRLVVGNERWTDSKLATRNAERARAHGVVCGAYFFPYPLPHLDPKEQVERFVHTLGGLGGALDELPPAFDMEWPMREEWKVIDGKRTLTYPWKKWGCSASQLRDWCLTAIEHGEKLTGLKWLVYSYRYWLKCIEAEKAPEFGERPLWLADYKFFAKVPTPEQARTVKPPAPWKRIAIVQHDGNGGLRLPNGVDSDFNFMPDAATLDELTQHAGKFTPIELPLKVGQPKNTILPENAIRAMRLARIDLEEAEERGLA